jgi:hypothetical protein
VLPFTREQFIAVFAAYNAGVWPAQIGAYLLGLGMVALLVWPSRTANRLIAAGLAAMWAWTGIAYHWVYFSSINKAALAFGALFVAQAVLFLYLGAIRERLHFGASDGALASLGWTLIAYAAIAYPLIGLWSEPSRSEIPMFGITPCPVTIFTFGLLLLTTAPVSRWLLVIPFLWSLIGGSAAFLLGIPQDWLLAFSGVAAVLIVCRDRGCRFAAQPGHLAGGRRA